MKMKWYNFWVNVHLPLLLINELYFLFNYLKVYDFQLFAHELLIYIYICFAIYSMEKKQRGTMTHIVIILIVESIAIANPIVYSTNWAKIEIDSILSFIFNFIVLLFIWVFPNYIYFEKRKDIFIN